MARPWDFAWDFDYNRVELGSRAVSRGEAAEFVTTGISDPTNAGPRGFPRGAPLKAAHFLRLPDPKTLGFAESILGMNAMDKKVPVRGGEDCLLSGPYPPLHSIFVLKQWK